MQRTIFRPTISGCFLAALVAMTMLPALSCVATASESVILEHRSPDLNYHRPPPRFPPFGIRNPQQFDPVRDVDVGVILPPEQLEHWRSNYVPDSYRLNGYDDVRKGEANVCRHRDGSRSYSSSGMTCEDGNANPPGGRTWSTK
ncbi:hypothetical protein [Kushneria konosiri]|uniref:Uncharacterized protein n=1 Tax=Kushneria konosiri TaxID=698828 RepID=A0A2Z2H6J0_9GAMM|nr:hypothetical protein [Kushneria konosiri]ARS52985.1 hypothetical protein B9G99_08905 [Kushneria konosiri]